MLFGFVAVLFTLLLIFEAATYWHARNVLDEAAAEGARVAAAFDGTCADGVTASRRLVSETAGSWANGVEVTCADGPMITVMVTAGTPGVLGNAFGFRVRVSESVPKER